MSGWGPLVLPGGGGTSPTGNSSLPDDARSVYGEVSLVPTSSETTILTWVVPPGVNHILRVEFGGENIAQYRLKYDGIVEARDITYFGDNLSSKWDFTTSNGAGVEVPSGTVVTVTVTHERPNAGSFWARLQYIDIN